MAALQSLLKLDVSPSSFQRLTFLSWDSTGTGTGEGGEIRNRNRRRRRNQEDDLADHLE
jgi:hypothetical protein